MPKKEPTEPRAKDIFTSVKVIEKNYANAKKALEAEGEEGCMSPHNYVEAMSKGCSPKEEKNLSKWLESKGNEADSCPEKTEE